MARFALFGFRDPDLPRVAHLIGDALTVHLDMRESSFKGGEYFLHRDVDGREISVEGNVRDEEGILTEPDFPAYAVLIYVNYSNLLAESRISKIDGLEFLRVEEI
ncbi:hypothetical protein [Streptomyces sp. NRRL WC-3744]|uniref:hypothetical protein n=1 Tax=Streptomyces sp. NRRL WC-3744 TaxID=1463935 RepID=UPI00131C24DE|nr:hypothetical protein [Streptomyces sp. NRRL WC-3744]